MNIVLIGYGKMGHEVERVLLERGHKVSFKVDAGDEALLNPRKLKGIDAAIEFTTPTTAYDNVVACLRAGVPIVCGTTGWNNRIEDVRKLCREVDGTFFYASNFSLGVNIFFEINKRLAAIMNRFPEYDVNLREIHHIHKRDAPSGTAVVLANDILEAIDRKSSWVNHETLEKEVLGIVSEREGEVPGTHEVTYSSEADKIDIIHTAHGRRGLALGAVMAAEFTRNHHGVLTMSDMLNF